MARGTIKFISMLVLLSCTLTGRLACSQTYAHGLNQCAHEFYDTHDYNWISYENTCKQEIHVTLVGTSKPYSGGLDIKPGAHKSPGLSEKEVETYGGLTVYVCPAGFHAVDAADRPIVLKVVDKFTCKK
jgi:hypothetical protein